MSTHRKSQIHTLYITGILYALKDGATLNSVCLCQADPSETHAALVSFDYLHDVRRCK